MDSHADHSDESAVSYALIGGAADRQNDDEGMAVPIDDNWEFGDVPANDVQGQQPPLAPWSLAGPKLKQQEDQDISFVMKLMEDNVSKPSWKDVALSSHVVKTLWTQWLRLAIKDGLLKRRFESADGKSVQWQVVMPVSLRSEFMQMAHGGMTGSHFGHRRTSAAIQSRPGCRIWRSFLSSAQLVLVTIEVLFHGVPDCSRHWLVSLGKGFLWISLDHIHDLHGRISIYLPVSIIFLSGPTPFRWLIILQ